MPALGWILIVVAVLAVASVFVPPFFIAHKVYNDQLVRKTKDMWTRDCSWPDDKEQVEMYKIGKEWEIENQSFKSEVDIYNDNLHLFGEYFDFGFKKCVIIVPGRMEGLCYSYFFAKPYKLSGYNVLVVDNRAHGLSDGKYNALGLKEYKDYLAWAKMLNEQKGIEHIIFHGICIGAAGSLYACTAENCPSYIKGLVADGMYTTFYETFKNHMIEDKRPVFPFIHYVFFFIKVYAGVNAKSYGPEKAIKKLDKPILMLYGEQDKFSLPEKSKELYQACPSVKKIVWFEKGAHSHLRINAPEKYDQAIIDFIKENFND